jgi:hypothetical protein
MQSVQWSLAETETPQRQTTEAARPDLFVPGKQTSSEQAPSDRQSATESLYATFAWLFGSGCY